MALWNAKGGRVAVNGDDMDYVRFGRGKRAAVVLPGLSDGLATVRGKALLLVGPYRAFLDDFTVYMFSRRNNLPEGHAIRDMAADLAAAMAALGIDRACVVGVSQGGMIAQYLAIDHPDSVERLVLAVTAPSANDVVRSAVGGWIDMARAGDHRRLMIDTAEKSYSDAWLAKRRRLLPMLGLVGRPKSYDRFLANANAILGFDATAELAKIACPTLILGGACDRTVGPQAAPALHAAIPRSALHIYPGLGHAVYEEAPDFYARVFGFFAQG